MCEWRAWSSRTAPHSAATFPWARLLSGWPNRPSPSRLQLEMARNLRPTDKQRHQRLREPCQRLMSRRLRSRLRRLSSTAGRPRSAVSRPRARANSQRARAASRSGRAAAVARRLFRRRALLGRRSLGGRYFGRHFASELERAMDPHHCGIRFRAPGAGNRHVALHRTPRHRFEIPTALLANLGALVIGEAHEKVLAEEAGEHVAVHEGSEVSKHWLQCHSRFAWDELAERHLGLITWLGHRPTCHWAHRFLQSRALTLSTGHPTLIEVPIGTVKGGRTWRGSLRGPTSKIATVTGF